MRPRAGVVARVVGRVLLARGRALAGLRPVLARGRALAVVRPLLAHPRPLARPSARARWRALAGLRPLLADRQARTAPPAAFLMIPEPNPGR